MEIISFIVIASHPRSSITELIIRRRLSSGTSIPMPNKQVAHSRAENFSIHPNRVDASFTIFALVFDTPNGFFLIGMSVTDVILISGSKIKFPSAVRGFRLFCVFSNDSFK